MHMPTHAERPGLVMLVVALLATACVTAPRTEVLQAAPVRSAAPGLARSGDYVQDKNFFLLTLLQSAAARAALEEDRDLSDIAKRLSPALDRAYKGCDGTTRCAVQNLMLQEPDVSAIGRRLAVLASPGGPLNTLVRDSMRPSGLFARHAALEDGAMMEKAWQDTAAGVNRLYRVYGLGEAPRYPAIDSMSYAPESPEYRSLVKAALETQLDGKRSTDAFFADWLRIGLDLLAINQRDEASRYEPMDQGVNARAFARAARIDWSEAPYVAILVPGAGAQPGETGLSAAGALRVRLAVRRYNDGLAPFIIVSGGHVHPNKTPYAEAVEMKRALMTQYGVPEHAILIDPHARHTTTNLRNGVRLLHALGAPEEGLVLVTTSRDQSLYIESPVFARRNEDELGYQPLTMLKRISPHDLVMAQNLISLQADPMDPLDP